MFGTRVPRVCYVTSSPREPRPSGFQGNGRRAQGRDSPDARRALQEYPVLGWKPSCTCPPPPNQGSSHCPAPSDQDDLTCLSWLHQGTNLLPIQPLARTSSTAVATVAPGAPGKPPFSFSSLIFMAIEDSPEKSLPVQGIYEWIVRSFPYYRSAPGGWRNSVRHNLSLSKSFHRTGRDRSQGPGKGSLWRVCPEHRPALAEALRKTQHCQGPGSVLAGSVLSGPVL
uniref:Fork-head domain-containing protein n=1 Tax=Denticeps clupeoides TaxID=299321 RepID=A0AAY4DCX3_9TELE